MSAEDEALLAIREDAPLYSSLLGDWEGDPSEWRIRIKRSPEGAVIDM